MDELTNIRKKIDQKAKELEELKKQEKAIIENSPQRYVGKCFHMKEKNRDLYFYVESVDDGKIKTTMLNIEKEGSVGIYGDRIYNYINGGYTIITFLEFDNEITFGEFKNKFGYALECIGRSLSTEKYSMLSEKINYNNI